MLSAFPLMMGSFSVTPRALSKTPEQVPKVITFFVSQVADGLKIAWRELQSLTASELDRWGAIVKAIGLRLD